MKNGVKVGSRLMYDGGEYILCTPEPDGFQLINLLYGNRWDSTMTCEFFHDDDGHRSVPTAAIKSFIGDAFEMFLINDDRGEWVPLKRYLGRKKKIKMNILD